MSWYDAIGNDKTNTTGMNLGVRYATGEMDKVSKIARSVNSGSFADAMSSNMAKYGFIGTIAGALAGFMTKKNILMLALAGTGVGSMVGYAIDVRASIKNTSTSSNETNQEE